MDLPIFITGQDVSGSRAISRFVRNVETGAERIRNANFRIIEPSIRNTTQRVEEAVEASNRWGMALGGVKVAMLGVGAAAVAGLTQSGKFNRLIGQAGALANATGEELKVLRREALFATEGLGLTPPKVAQLAVELKKAGLSAEELATGLPAAAKLIVASMEEIGPEQAGKLLKQASSTFVEAGNDFEGTAAVFTAAAANTAIDFKKLPLSFGIVAGAAGKVNASFEETVALSALIANVFPTNVRRGATGVRSLMDALADVNERVAIEAAFGIEVFDRQTGKMKTMTQVLNDLIGSMIKMPKETRATAISMAGLRREVQTGLIGLTQISETGLKNYEEGMKAGGIATAEFAAMLKEEFETKATLRRTIETFQKTLPGALSRNVEAWSRLGVVFGTLIEPFVVPALEAITNFVNSLAHALEDANPALKTFVGLLGTAGALFVGGRVLRGLGAFFTGGLTAGALRRAAFFGGAGGTGLGPIIAGSAAGTAGPGILARLFGFGGGAAGGTARAAGMTALGGLGGRAAIGGLGSVLGGGGAAAGGGGAAAAGGIGIGGALGIAGLVALAALGITDIFRGATGRKPFTLSILESIGLVESAEENAAKRRVRDLELELSGAGFDDPRRSMLAAARSALDAGAFEQASQLAEADPSALAAGAAGGTMLAPINLELEGDRLASAVVDLLARRSYVTEAAGGAGVPG